MTLCIPLHMWTNTDVHPSRNFHKARGVLTHLDWSSLTATGPYLMRLVSSVVRSRLPTAPLRRPSPTDFSEFLCPTPDSRSLAHFRSCRRSRAQASIWFRTKTDKGIVCLADHIHSVTNEMNRKSKEHSQKAVGFCRNLYVWLWVCEYGRMLVWVIVAY